MPRLSAPNARVGLLIAPGAIGGAESVALGLAGGLASAGTEVHLLVLVGRATAHPFVREAERRGLTVDAIVTAPRRYDLQARRVAALLREHDLSVLHSHGYHADVVGAWAARLAQRAHVCTLHGFTTVDWRDLLYDLPVRLAHRGADAVIAVSAPVAERLPERGVRPARLHVIPNALVPEAARSRAEARAALGIAMEERRFGWVGRLAHEKGVDVALRAVAAASAVVPLSVVGDGPERADAEALARALGVASRVTWHGAVANAGRLLPAFDALVLSSHTEGTPMVLLEAMATRVPIIATRVGGVPRMLAADEALLVEPGRPDALAEAITSVAHEPEAARARAERAHARLRRDFDPSAWIETHRALYARVTAPRTR